jgi:hypothetical protein
MEAAGFFAALVGGYQTNWHEIPEGSNFKKIYIYIYTQFKQIK